MATQNDIQAFIKLIAEPVINICKLKGWGVPSAIIAQAGIESAWGTSGLWKTCFNGWGMKYREGCGTDYKEYKTKEQRPDGTYYEITAKFRTYPNVTSGIKGYFDFIESYSRYRPLLNCKTYEDYAKTIRACGWATSLSYANNIINTVRKYNLTIYDTYTFNYVEGATYTLLSNMYIREAPMGEKVKHNCITENAMVNSKFDDYGNTILKKGTRVTCKSVETFGNATWIQIPSGWICAEMEDKRYII